MTKENLLRYGKEYLHDLETACCEIEELHLNFVRESIKALEQERSRSAEITQYRHDCEKLMEENERLKKALEQEPCTNAISRQSAIFLASDLKQDLPDDERIADMVMAHNEGILEYQTQLSLLPPVNPQQKTGHWISFGVQGEVDGQIVQNFSCSECGAISIFRLASGNIINGDLCPNCGAKMVEPQESEGYR